MCRWWLCGETICLDAGAVRHSFYPWVGKKPWRRARRPTPAFLPGESPGPRSRLAAVHRSRRVGHDWSDLARTDHVSLHRYYNISTETLHCFNLGLPGGSVIKSWLANSGDVGSIPGLGRSLQEEMATHYSVLDWKIPWTEEPGGLQSMGSQKSWTRLSEWAHRPAAPL